MPMDYMHWGAGMMVVMSLLSLIVLAGIIAGVVFLVRSLSRRETQPDPGARAMAILEERFARGEIDRDEYESRRHLLTRAHG